jgi:glycerophosphoryl diester phosphodiesterase
MPASVFERVVLAATEFDTFDVVHVYAADADPSLVAQIHARGLVAHTNDAASRDEMERALDAGVDRLSTDHVQLAREVVPIPS